MLVHLSGAVLIFHVTGSSSVVRQLSKTGTSCMCGRLGDHILLPSLRALKWAWWLAPGTQIRHGVYIRSNFAGGIDMYGE